MNDKAVLVRIRKDDKQTLGYLHVYDGDTGVQIASCVTLELADRENRVGISRIPAGTYKVTEHTSPTLGKCFLVNDVPGRSAILIHVGNFYTQIRGCILVGREFSDVNGDGHQDVVQSRFAMNLLLHLTDGFSLTILDNEIG
jgi:Family of unknown function (DUF5675)